MNKYGDIVQEYLEQMEESFVARDFQVGIDQALDLYAYGKANNNEEALCYGARALMKAYYTLGDYPRSFKYGEALLDLLEYGNQAFEVSVYQFLGPLFFELEDYKEAEFITKKIIELSQASNDFIRLFEGYLNLTMVLLEIGRYEESFHTIKQAKGLVERFEHNRTFVEYLVESMTIKTLIKTGDLVQAKTLLDGIGEEHCMGQSQCDQKLYYENYGVYYEAIGDYNACASLMMVGYENALKSGDAKYQQIFLEKICKYIDEVELVEDRINYLKLYAQCMEDHQKSRIDKLAVNLYSRYHRYLERKNNRFDSLTGVLNRDSLDKDMESIKATDHVTCMIMDVDDFKSFNDGYGHQVGDQVLREVCQHLVDVVKDLGNIYRFGGDEFVVLLQDKSDQEVMALANEIITSYQDISLDLVRTALTTSIGIVSTGEVTPDKLFYAADMALYGAKAKGKNCIEVYEG